MVRSVYYQSSENPIQYDRLPAGSPELELARYSSDPDEDARFARRRFFTLALAAPSAALIHLAHLAARAFAPDTTLLVSTIVLVLLAGLPAACVLLAIAVGQVAFALLGVIVLVVYQTYETVLHWRRCCIGTLLKAWGSWLSYNRTDDPLPDIFQSPSGTACKRFFIPATAAFLFSLALVPHLVEYPLGLLGVIPMAELRLAAGCGLKNSGLVAFLVELAVVVLMPPFLVGLVPVAASMPLLHEVTRYVETKVNADNWTDVIADMRTSVDPIERKSLYIGRNIFDGSPLLVPREVFQEHAHFLGDSGSGKTSLGLAPLVEQLIAGQPCSVIVVDLKADSLELYAAIQAAAQDCRRQYGKLPPLKHFTNESDRSTFAFNPLRQPFYDGLDLYQKTDILCAALGLNYGADYGESYYSSANATVLFQTMKHHPDIKSLQEAAQQVRYFGLLGRIRG